MYAPREAALAITQCKELILLVCKAEGKVCTANLGMLTCTGYITKGSALTEFPFDDFQVWDRLNQASDIMKQLPVHLGAIRSVLDSVHRQAEDTSKVLF